MRKTADGFKKMDGERRIKVLKLEVDYELATLYEAMLENNEAKKMNVNENLKDCAKNSFVCCRNERRQAPPFLHKYMQEVFYVERN